MTEAEAATQSNNLPGCWPFSGFRGLTTTLSRLAAVIVGVAAVLDMAINALQNWALIIAFFDDFSSSWNTWWPQASSALIAWAGSALVAIINTSMLLLFGIVFFLMGWEQIAFARAEKRGVKQLGAYVETTVREGIANFLFEFDMSQIRLKKGILVWLTVIVVAFVILQALIPRVAWNWIYGITLFFTLYYLIGKMIMMHRLYPPKVEIGLGVRYWTEDFWSRDHRELHETASCSPDFAARFESCIASYQTYLKRDKYNLTMASGETALNRERLTPSFNQQ